MLVILLLHSLSLSGGEHHQPNAKRVKTLMDLRGLTNKGCSQTPLSNFDSLKQR